MDLSLIVPSRGGRDRLARHLATVTSSLDALGISWEGIVVDDASPSQTAADASALPGGCRLVRLPRNCGTAAARNSGVRSARGRWLLMLDDDVEFHAADLRLLWEARREDLCVVPEVRGRAGELQNAIVRTSKLFEPRWSYGRVPIREVDYPLGACFLVSRGLFDRAGGFDERFRPNYFEDTAFGAALRKVGGRTVMVPFAVAHHLAPGSGDGERPRRQRAAVQRNRWRYILHYGVGPSRVLALALAPVRVIRESVALRSTAPLRALVDIILSELRGLCAGSVRRERSGVTQSSQS